MWQRNTRHITCLLKKKSDRKWCCLFYQNTFYSLPSIPTWKIRTRQHVLTSNWQPLSPQYLPYLDVRIQRGCVNPPHTYGIQPWINDIIRDFTLMNVIHILFTWYKIFLRAQHELNISYYILYLSCHGVPYILQFTISLISYYTKDIISHYLWYVSMYRILLRTTTTQKQY